MILVDSSAWIEYYRSSGRPAIRRAGAELYHLDAHFDQMALHSNLHATNLAKTDNP